MKAQRLLYLSAHQMAAYHWHAGTLVCEEIFSGTETGLQQFAIYLAKNVRSTFSLLANVADEGFHIETIPFLRGTDRKAVIERKLGQAFFNAPLTASRSLGHEKSRRKDERILLAALTNSAFFQPWLEVIRKSEVALAGIFSLPLLTPFLLKKFHLDGGPCLLLTVQDQSLRQNYIENGELRFSRLTSLQHSSIGSIAQTFSSESMKLQQYLASQRLIARNQPITAHLLAHPDIAKVIQNSCIDTPTIRYNVMDITECARRSGLKTIPVDTHGEGLFLHLLATVPNAIQFAPDDLRHAFHIDRLRWQLRGLGVLSLIGCLLFSAKLFYDAHEISGEAAALRTESALTRQRYNDIVATFPIVPTDNETLKRTMDRYMAQEKRSTLPNGFYREVSIALHAEPAIELDSLEWKIGGAENESNSNAGGKSTQGTWIVPEDSEGLVLGGTVRLGANPTPRQLLATFNRFVDKLKSNPAWHVDVIQQPVDLESGKSLRIGDSSVEDSKPRTFSLNITRKIGS